MSADYGADFGGRAVLGDDLLNEFSLDTVDDPIACSGNKMTIRYDIYSFLSLVNHVHNSADDTNLILILLLKSLKLVGTIAGVDSESYYQF